MAKRSGLRHGVLKRHRSPEKHHIKSCKQAREKVLPSSFPSSSDAEEPSGEDLCDGVSKSLISSSCEENDTKGCSADQVSSSTSTFDEHLGHILSNEEVENLKKGRWKYNWEVPAINMASCKWTGTGRCFLNDELFGRGLTPKLHAHWLNLYSSSGEKDFHSSIRSHFLSLCSSYHDILHHNKIPFYNKGLKEDLSTMDAYLMHSLNHVFRTRNCVKKNDAKMAKHPETTEEEILSGCFVDQGFTRPKVLILLPLRSIAFRVVKKLVRLTPEAKVDEEQFERFCDEFGVESASDIDNDDGSNDQHNSLKHGKLKPLGSSKPSDFEALFGGNNDDEFMIGIKFTRKCIKLYSDFYSSDIIIASPVKLHMTIGRAEEEKERDVDYLSSIEILIVDHADVISMQNWSFLSSVVDHLNVIPSKQHGTDLMRIRRWYLDGYAKFYRQNIILSSYLTPEMNALFNHHCMSYKGKVKLVCEHKGILQKVLLQVRQIYERFDADSVIAVDDARFDYFTKKIFPKIKDSVQGGIMIFIHSYFEFVRLRNFLKSQNASFCLLGDYTKAPDISRARLWFFEGKRKIMLYTERAYFYRRYKIRGTKDMIIYSLPERKEFYPEIVNMLEASHDMTCNVLFSRFDQLRLERIVGSASSKRMMVSEKSIFAFC